MPLYKIKKSNIDNKGLVAAKDIKKGKTILDCISKFDIGQSLVIQSGNIIAIEAAQGTDKLIRDSYNYLNKNETSILIKLAKVKQKFYFIQ